MVPQKKKTKFHCKFHAFLIKFYEMLHHEYITATIHNSVEKSQSKMTNNEKTKKLQCKKSSKIQLAPR